MGRVPSFWGMLLKDPMLLPVYMLSGSLAQAGLQTDVHRSIVQACVGLMNEATCYL